MEKTKITCLGLVAFVTLLWLLPSVGTSQGANSPLPPNTPRANEAPDVTRRVDCNSGQTIQEAVNNSNNGDMVLVSGTCFENVTVGDGRTRVTLDGQGAATITGGPAAATGPNVVVIRGRGITIKGFTITGGRDGIQVNSGGNATLDGNFIHSTGRQGVNVNNSSFARILNNTIQNNPQGGIIVNGGSTVDIGFTGTPDDRVSSPNIIQNNGGTGINVQRSSGAQIGYSTIINNTNRGINVAENSHAQIGGLSDTGPSGNIVNGNTGDGIRVSGSSRATIQGNTITNNTGRGVFVSDSSSANIVADLGATPSTTTPNIIHQNGLVAVPRDGILVSSSSSAFISDNSISNNTNVGVSVNRASHAAIRGNTIDGNSGDGIRVEENSGVNLDTANSTTANNVGRGLTCRIGAYARGSLGTINGNVGQTSFDATCINALGP